MVNGDGSKGWSSAITEVDGGSPPSTSRSLRRTRRSRSPPRFRAPSSRGRQCQGPGRPKKCSCWAACSSSSCCLPLSIAHGASHLAPGRRNHHEPSGRADRSPHATRAGYGCGGVEVERIGEGQRYMARVVGRGRSPRDRRRRRRARRGEGSRRQGAVSSLSANTSSLRPRLLPSRQQHQTGRQWLATARFEERCTLATEQAGSPDDETQAGDPGLGATVPPQDSFASFPGGFADETYVDWERGYKWQAHERWMAALAPIGFAICSEQKQFAEIATDAVAIESRTNLLSRSRRWRCATP